MKDFRVKLVAGLCLMIGFFVVLGYAGKYDCAEQIILRMSYEEYDSIKQLLTNRNGGHSPSELEIAQWWSEHHQE